MTILRFNWITLIILYAIAITLGFLYNQVLGWCISLYCLSSGIYYTTVLTISKKNKNETDLGNNT